MLAAGAVSGVLAVLLHRIRGAAAPESPDTAPGADSAVVIPDRLRRAETVLAHRTSRVLLVLEASIDENNHQVPSSTMRAAHSPC